MKILYVGSIFTSDSDFPLVKNLIERGHEVFYLVPLSKAFLRAGLFDIKKFIPHTGIYRGTDYEELKVYAKYIDLSRLFIVNLVDFRTRYIPTFLLWVKVFLFFFSKRVDILHSSWPLEGMSKILYRLPCKKVVMVHDPFQHSSIKESLFEKNRKIAFKKADKLVLLSTPLLEKFCSYYDIPKNKILVNQMGEFDYMRVLESSAPRPLEKYILFFGYIAGYKGLEYLCQAMVEIHKKHPELKLLIAGGGKIYFDFTPYQNLDYIELRNRYIPTEELAVLLKDCEFSVCPYKDATQSGVVQTTFSLATPMIVTNVGALPDSVIDGRYGKVIPPRDVDAIVQACCFLYEQPQLLHEMRSNIRMEWSCKMSWSPIVDKYVEVYEELMEK